jgi:hypothetical protein
MIDIDSGKVPRKSFGKAVVAVVAVVLVKLYFNLVGEWRTTATVACFSSVQVVIVCTQKTCASDRAWGLQAGYRHTHAGFPVRVVMPLLGDVKRAWRR